MNQSRTAPGDFEVQSSCLDQADLLLTARINFPVYLGGID